MELTELIQRTLVRLSLAEYPKEACGILTQHELVQMPNGSPLPEESFVMEAEGDRILYQPESGILPYDFHGYAIWHSHPRSRAVPTRPDMDLMRQTLVPMIIVSLMTTVPEIAVFKLDEHNRFRACCVRTYRPN